MLLNYTLRISGLKDVCIAYVKRACSVSLKFHLRAGSVLRRTKASKKRMTCHFFANESRLFTDQLAYGKGTCRKRT